MSNAKFYDYYKTTAKTAAATYKIFKAGNPASRNEVLNALVEQYGAVAWSEDKHWGGSCTTVSALAFDEDTYEIPKHVKVVNRDYFEGKPIVVVRGKLNSKAGVEFNAGIDAANAKLVKMPQYKDWVVTHFDVMRTELGRENTGGRGVAMLSSYGGECKGVLVFAVVKSEKNPAVIPECFIKITYGKFYDMVEG